MGKPNANKKVFKPGKSLSFIDGLYNRASASVTKYQAHRPVGARILPAARWGDQMYLVHLMAVVTTAASEQHCVARNQQGIKCKKDNRYQDAVDAVRGVNFFSSNVVELLGVLNHIAVLSICKNYQYRNAHYLQAGGIVEKWMADASAMAKESYLGMKATEKAMRRVSHRQLTMGGAMKEARFEEVDDSDEEGEDEDDDEAELD